MWKWREGFKVKYYNLWVFFLLGISDGNCFSVDIDVSVSPVSASFTSDWHENKYWSNSLKWWVGPAQLLSALKEGTVLDLPGTRQLLLPSTDSNGSYLGNKVHGEENTFLSRHWLRYSTPTLVPWLVKWALYNYKLPVWKCLNELLMTFLAWKAQTTIIVELLLFTDPSFTKKLRVKLVQGWAGRCACWLSTPR